MLPIKKKISPYNHYKGNDIKYIVIHYIGATGTAKNNADYFYNGDRQASAHYFVGETECWQSVEDFNGAWHCGNTRTEVNNKNSIGIEMECANPQLLVTDKTIQNTCELVVYLMKKYNIPIENVRTHYEVSGKTKLCPNFANTNRWIEMKNKIKSMLNVTKPSSNSVEMYRIRKSWSDASSQKGAFSNKDNAISECKKYNGYCVFDSKGTQIYPTIVSKETTYAEKGTFYFTTAVTVRTAMEENAKTNAVYYAGESVKYHTVTLNKNGYNWVHYDRNNGQTGYLKIKDLSNGESYGYAR